MKIRGRLRHYNKQERDMLLNEVVNGSLLGSQIAEKVRKFCSLHRRHLPKVSRSRFGSNSSSMSNWMFDILYVAHDKYSKGGEIRIDAAYLSALLFLVDYTPSLTHRMADLTSLIEGLSQELKSNLLKSNLTQSDHEPWCYEDWIIEASAVGRVIIFCPNPYSLYTSVILHLCMMLKIQVVGVVVKKFTFNRMIFELQRDGLPRLAKKIVRKLILRTDENSDKSAVSLKTLHDGVVGAQPNILKTCKQHKIPMLEVDDFVDSMEWLTKQDPDAGLFTGGGMIPKSVLEQFKVGMLNLHMGILPQYKGMDVVQAPILEAKPVGLTAHLMAVELDAGPIIQTFEISTLAYESLGSLRNTLTAIIPVLIIDSLLGLFSGRLSLSRQSLVGRQYYVMHPLLIKLTDDILSYRYKNVAQSDSDIVSQNITKLLKYIEDKSGF